MYEAKEDKNMRERKQNEIIIGTKPTLDAETRSIVHTIADKITDNETKNIFSKFLKNHYKL